MGRAAAAPAGRDGTRRRDLAPARSIALWSPALVAVLLVLLLSSASLVTASASAITYNQTVAGMIEGVDANQGELLLTLNEITGAIPTVIGGQPYTVLTRYAKSGVPIDKAEQYVYEHLAACGLTSVAYRDFSASGVSGRNVIGEIRGTTKPAEIVVLCGHLDDYGGGDSLTSAPGADDNGSTVAAMLCMARVFGHYGFERTVRFVFFGGEEQGLIGSHVYAAAARTAGENIVAVVNADMLAYNANDSQLVELHTRTSGSGAIADAAIANQYVDVAATYAIAGIEPIVVADGATWSDHASFWTSGFSAICLIEDELEVDDPYYHTQNDTVANLTWPYYVAVDKGFVATAAHLADLGVALPLNDIYVEDVTMSGYRPIASYRARATVTVRDLSLAPVAGATVTGAFSGATNGTVGGVTDASGRVTLTSSRKKRPGGSWTFTVTGVAKSGWTYDRFLNHEASGSVTLP